MRRGFLLAVVGLLTLICCTRALAANTPGKIQVLIITGDDVDVHPWKKTAAATADILLKTGKFDVKTVEDLAVLDSAAELKPYDVIVLARFNRTAPLGEQAKENLLNFVRDGKGIFIQHLASASFPKWAEFGKLCGRYWVMGKSGHGKRSVFESKIVDKEHPITRGLGDFKTDDELYAKLAGTEPIHVLVEADSTWSKKTEPLVFWSEFGKGRMVHNAYGHDPRALLTPEVQKIIARGVEYAATGKVSE
jgi:uncharacterized protein